MAKKEFFRINDYTGGINNDQHTNLIEDNEATEIINFRLDKVRSLIVRKGLRQLVGINLPTGGGGT